VTEIDKAHAAALELAEQIATRLARLEPEDEIVPMIDRLRELVARVIELGAGR
jgi:hypothetical protein